MLLKKEDNQNVSMVMYKEKLNRRSVHAAYLQEQGFFWWAKTERTYDKEKSNDVRLGT
jgi:hypothetical protein